MEILTPNTIESINISFTSFIFSLFNLYKDKENINAIQAFYEKSLEKVLAVLIGPLKSFSRPHISANPE